LLNVFEKFFVAVMIVLFGLKVLIWCVICCSFSSISFYVFIVGCQWVFDFVVVVTWFICWGQRSCLVCVCVCVGDVVIGTFYIMCCLLLFVILSKQCNQFKMRANLVKERLEKADCGVNVILNPEKVYILW